MSPAGPDHDLEFDGLDLGLERAYAPVATREGPSSVLAALAMDGGPRSPVFLAEDPSPASAAVALAPRLEGRYRLSGEIGRGGVGVVLAGHDMDLGREVAVKMLQEGHARNRDAVRRFVEEAQIGSQLQHPGIVPIYEIALTKDRRPYFSMKLVRGRTLAEVLAARAADGTPHRRLLHIFESVCQTMAYAHARGVVHRDLKPSNIMVGAFGEVLVVDWGMGKILRRPEPAEVAPGAEAQGGEGPLSSVRTCDVAAASAMGSVLGTPRYMAPEQARGDVRRVDERADVFALGGLLCEILTGRPPWAAAGVAETVSAAARGDLSDALARLEACAAYPGFVAIARDCLAPRAEDRPRHAGEVQARVGQALAAIDERARQAETEAAEARVEVVAERRRRRLVLALVGTAGCLVITVLLGWMFVSGERRARAAEISARVDRALEEASRARRRAEGADRAAAPAVWAEAVAVARRAEDLAGAEGAPADAAARARLALEDLTASEAAAREAARLEAAEGALERQLLSIEVTLPYGGTQAGRGAALQAALRGHFGEAWQSLAPTEAAALISRSRIKASLLSALESWCTSLQEVQADSTWVEAVLDAADPSSFRARLHAAGWDREALRALADDPAFRDAPARWLQRLGQRLAKKGDVELGRAILLEAWRREPGDFWVLWLCAEAYGMGPQPRWDEMRRFLTAALALHPEASAVHNNLGLACMQSGDLGAAAEAFRRSMALEPGQAHARANLSTVLVRLGDMEGSVEALRELARLHPEFRPAHYNLALNLYMIGDLEGALSSYEAARVLDGSDPETLCNLALTLQGLGRFEEAVGIMRRGHEIGTKGADWKYRSDLWVKRAENLALFASARAGALDAGTAPATPQEARLLGIVAHARGRHRDAVRMLRALAEAGVPTWSDPSSGERFLAARAAVLAGAGAGQFLSPPTEEDMAAWRRDALAWLREELAALRGVAASATRPLGEVLAAWRSHRDLAPARGPALAGLPPSEREAWEAFWREVDAAIEGGAPR